MTQDRWLAKQRENEAIDRTPEVGGVADVVHIPLGHVPAIEQVQRSEDIARNRDGNHEDVDTHLRFEKD